MKINIRLPYLGWTGEWAKGQSVVDTVLLAVLAVALAVAGIALAFWAFSFVMFIITAAIHFWPWSAWISLGVGVVALGIFRGLLWLSDTGRI